MAVEIERKFLVDLARCPLSGTGEVICQGYIPTQGRTVVRVRIKGDSAYLTLKGENRGMVRTEFEYPIPLADARQMLEEFCGSQKIEKVRHTMAYDNHSWEIDVFSGANEGLVVAEVELGSESEKVSLPHWVTSEVTGDPRYYNSNLMDMPFSRWTAQVEPED